MSVIFPTQPAKVAIHLVPKGANMITYRVSDALVLSAWMPQGFQEINQFRTETDDDFYNNRCDYCDRNSCSFLENYWDEELEETDWDHPDLEGHCNVYDDGYHGQYCPKGFEKEELNVNFSISDMVFEFHISHLGESPRFKYIKDSAYLQAGRLDEDGFLEGTPVKMASNVFGTEDYPEGICWGYNPKPKNLRETATFFFTTPFNNDLTPLDCFEDNCDEINRYVDQSHFDHNYVNGAERFLTKTTDALMILDAEENIQAFYTMLMAGFKPLPEAPHVMLIPIKESDIEKNGKIYSGYETIPDDVGKTWFISPTGESEGLLVGQI